MARLDERVFIEGPSPTMPLSKAMRRHFTEAARAAAAEARRRKREERAQEPRGKLEVFVVRAPDESTRFGWEIRRFGGLVLDRGDVGFATQKAARAAGVQALSRSAVLT